MGTHDPVYRSTPTSHMDSILCTVCVCVETGKENGGEIVMVLEGVRLDLIRTFTCINSQKINKKKESK